MSRSASAELGITKKPAQTLLEKFSEVERENARLRIENAELKLEVTVLDHELMQNRRP